MINPKIRALYYILLQDIFHNPDVRCVKNSDRESWDELYRAYSTIGTKQKSVMIGWMLNEIKNND